MVSVKKQTEKNTPQLSSNTRGGRVVPRCWINFQCWGVLLIWIIVGQGPIVLAVGAGWGCLDIFFSRLSSLFFLPLWEIAGYRLKYCTSQRADKPKTTNDQMLLLSRAMISTVKRCCKMVSSTDPGQTAYLMELSDLGLQCSFWYIYPST